MHSKTAARKIAGLAALSLLLQGCITSAPKAVIPEASVTTDKIADGAVTNGKMAGGSVNTLQLVDASVTTAKIADTAVTTAKLGTIDISAFTNFVKNSGQTGAIVVGPSDANSFVVQTNGVTRGTFASDGQIVFGHSDTTNFATTAGKVGSKSQMLAADTVSSTELYVGALDIGEQTGTGTTTQLVGVEGRQTNSNGTGVVTTGIGVNSEIRFDAAGTVTNGYGFHTKVNRTVNSVTGTLTNYRGLWIEDPDNTTTTASGNTRYGVFVDGAAKNFFLGNVGIGAGQTNPTFALSATGSINATVGLDAGGVQVCTAAGCTAVSDMRLKENVKPLENSLAKVLSLNGISYDFKDKERFGASRQIGFSAQELEKTFPQVVRTDDHTGFKSVSYGNLIAPLVEAVKELYSKWSEDHQAIDQQKVKLSSLEKKVELENLALKAENKSLKDRLEKIEFALAQAAPEKSFAKKKGRKLAQVK